MDDIETRLAGMDDNNKRYKVNWKDGYPDVVDTLNNRVVGSHFGNREAEKDCFQRNYKYETEKDNSENIKRNFFDGWIF